MTDTAGKLAGLPSGSVTFLFTDVEGSTRLFQQLGDGFVTALEEHRTLIRDAVTSRGGAIVKTEGDGLFIAFDNAVAAVEACLDAQLQMQSHPWQEGSELRVRMGLHTGNAEPTPDNDYLSVVVHRAARVAAAAHGGQVILSEETTRLVRRHLPEAASLGDRGAFRLKDFDEPEHLYQLLHKELPSSFPPLRASPVQSRGLPDSRTSFVGRRDELQSIIDLLREHRLVCLVGPGGAGKTRLALEAAARLATEFEGGVQLCDLSPIMDGRLVPAAIASSLRMDHSSDLDPIDATAHQVADIDTLILLDNCEQVLAAAATTVDALLDRAKGLRVLATSREPLGLIDERVWRINPLELPEADAGLDQIRESESGRLFEERARSVQSSFLIDEQNAEAVRSLCRQLEGSPLALELAAAYLGSMPVSRLAAKLGDQLPTLGEGHRRSVSRHRTLEATIEWSYRLLSDDERALFRSLAVLVGGFSLEAAEAVGGPVGTLEALIKLVRTSLIVWDADADRYHMLESIRQFAFDRLSESDTDLDRAREAHADFFSQLTSEAKKELIGSHQAQWLDLLSRDHENLRRAIGYLSDERGDAEGAVRMLTGLARYWMIRANTSEWTSTAMPLLEKLEKGGSDLALGQALVAATLLLAYQDASRADGVGKKALEVGRHIGDEGVIAEAMSLLAAIGFFRGEPDPEAGELALAQSRNLGDPVITGLAFLCCGLSYNGNPAASRPFYEEGLAITRQSGDDFIRYLLLGDLALVELNAGDLDAAELLVEESLTLGEKLGYADPITMALWGDLLIRKGDWERAPDVLRAYLRSVALSPYQALTAIQGIAQYAIALGDYRDAALLFGFADQTMQTIGMKPTASEAASLAHDRAILSEKLGAEFDAAYRTGAEMSWENVRHHAFIVTERAPSPSTQA